MENDCKKKFCTMFVGDINEVLYFLCFIRYIM